MSLSPVRKNSSQRQTLIDLPGRVGMLSDACGVQCGHPALWSRQWWSYPPILEVLLRQGIQPLDSETLLIISKVGLAHAHAHIRKSSGSVLGIFPNFFSLAIFKLGIEAVTNYDPKAPTLP